MLLWRISVQRENKDVFTVCRCKTGFIMPVTLKGCLCTFSFTMRGDNMMEEGNLV